MATKWELYVNRWKRGCGSDQCSRRGTRVVLARGAIPCDLLFIGEAPGESENAIAQPFIGPAGHLLDSIIAEATRHSQKKWRLAFTNMVGCIPREEDGSKSTEPDADQITTCADRLAQLVALAQPRIVVLVGKVAANWSETGIKGCLQIPAGTLRVEVTHPAAILRANPAARDHMSRLCIVRIRKAAEAIEYNHDPEPERSL